MFKVRQVVSSGLLLASLGCGNQGDVDEPTSEALSTPAGGARNDYGVAETFHSSGSIDLTNPFFAALGSNPRTCATCHSADQGWTMTAEANNISTKKARKQTFEPQTINLAVTRFTRSFPPAAGADFAVTAVADPSGFSTTTSFLNYRRPTPVANESKVSSITNTAAPVQDIQVQLAGLMRGAAQLHEQRDPANPVPVDQQNAGRDFMFGVFFAQTVDKFAGRLDAAGALGGPVNLASFPFMLGMNDPATPSFDRRVFTLFDAWKTYDDNHSRCDWTGEARAAIYRGQEVFNTHEFDISGVPGFNDAVGQETYRGTCSSCHNVPNVGGHSVIRMMDIGTADPPNCDPSFPLVTATNTATGATRTVCDLGRGLAGKWADIARFRVPPLRGLASRAPYFHDGGAKNIKEAIKYHEKRFNVGLTRNERADLEAFLGAL
jgi:cytochrome c peroxidase